ncbi:MAG TPA: hypothetical protein VFZ65_10110 [Planctomycetota bacterium]|nr:hypothetical protein [Planctomycetota bacterium]
MQRHQIVHGFVIALGLATAASAQVVVNSNITTSTTWLATNVYQLQGDVYVEPGATLTIQAGTVIASVANSALAVCRGAQIIANGTKDAPIIFTSTADRATWTAGNPKTGTFRQTANNEWGNLTIMGSAYISENQTLTNTPAPSASNYADMEGLTPANTSLNDYGGGNDNDDSGSLSYVSLRYGGLSIAVGVELNGLSLGGIGRNTEIHHIEVLNNLDDCIEVWGGTVNFKYLSLWNAGDDSFDLDQGWRGKAQYGLIVQGHSGTGSQGSGFGDNAIEIDGAELCHWQPVTTATIYNFTVIGNPHPTQGSSAGDHLTAWRDNANVQFHNCIFMDSGDNVINNDISDFENGNTGYGCNGTLSFAARWTTPYTVTSPINPFGSPAAIAAAYTAQTSGNLIEFRDNIFYNNLRPNAYVEANAQNVFTGGGGTNNANNSIVTLSPITTLTRGPAVVPNGVNTSQPVIFIDPTPQNDALTAVEFAPNDGFYTSSRFRGAFKRGNNWLSGWTATSAFGMTSSSLSNVDLEKERPGLHGAPVHYCTGNWAAGTPVTIAVENIDPAVNIGILVFGGPLQFNFPIFGGTLVPTPDVINVVVGAAGAASFGPFVMPAGLGGQTFHTQWASFDTGVPVGEFAFSNAQAHIVP